MRWMSNYDRVQCCAVALLYIQAAGSIGAAYGGVSIANLGVALFAVVAVESGSQNLGRTYAVLLASMLLLDIAWLILFSSEIWQASRDSKQGLYYRVSVKIVFFMEVIGFTMRLVSSFLWIQMYRLGASKNLSGLYQQLDFGGVGTVGFITPLSTPAPSRQVSSARRESDSVGGSIYDPAYYTSLFGKLNEETSEISEEEKTGI